MSRGLDEPVARFLESLAEAQALAPAHARSRVLEGQWALAAAQPEAAIRAFEALLTVSPDSFNLVAADFAKAAQLADRTTSALAQLQERYRLTPSLALLRAMELLDPEGHAQRLQFVLHVDPQRQTALFGERLHRLGMEFEDYRAAWQAGAVRQQANERQELLIAELNHRVRNILGVIRGLIRQSQRDVTLATTGSR